MSARISSLPTVVSGNILDTDIMPIVTGIAANLGVTKRVSITELRLKLGTTPPAGGRTVTSAATYLLNNAVFNVKDWGAFGDGTTNDTTAIQNAINACDTAGGGTVYMPIGTYSITGISIPANNITLAGAGSHFAYGTAARRFTILKARSGVAASIVQLVLNPGAIPDVSTCYLRDFSVDGSIAGTPTATIGIRSTGANIIERVHVRGCLSAGLQLYNFTNQTQVLNCGFVDNFGYGIQSIGPSTTPFTIRGCNVQLNLLGGVRFEGGFNVTVEDTIIESNGNFGLSIFRQSANTNDFGNFYFRSIWFEDNPTAIIIDAGTRSEANAPSNITFEHIHVGASHVTDLYANILCGRWVRWRNCHFSGSTAAIPIVTSANSYYCEISNSVVPQIDGGLTDAQADAFVAGGFRCFWTDRQTRRYIGVGVAPGFDNSWVNYGAPFGPARYWFDDQGDVHLGGAIKTGTIGVRSFLLPVGYRPATDKYFPLAGNGIYANLTISSAGQVTVTVGTNSFISLEGVVFATGD